MDVPPAKQASTDDRLRELFEEYRDAPLQLWSRLLTCLHLAPSPAAVDHDLLAEILAHLQEESTLESMWRSIFAQSSPSDIVDVCHPLLHCPRILTNLFQQDIDEVLPTKRYHHRTCRSLIHSFSSTRNTSSYAELIEHLPHDMAHMFVHTLLSTEAFPLLKFLHVMNLSWSLKNLVIALQLHHSYPDRNYLLNHLHTWIEVVASKSTSMQAISKKLFLQKTFNESIANMIVNRLPMEHVPHLCHLLCEVWGERLYISRGYLKSILYLFSAIYACVDRLSMERLTNFKLGNQSLSLTISLSTCIGNYLDSSDSQFRLFGMKLAKLFASKMGKEIHFDELIELETQVKDSKQDRADQSTEIALNKEQLDEEDKVEFEPYYDPELETDFATKTKEHFKRIYYLSICLQSMNMLAICAVP